MNYEFVLPVDAVVSGITPQSLQYAVDLVSVPWLKQDAAGARCVEQTQQQRGCYVFSQMIICELRFRSAL